MTVSERVYRSLLLAYPAAFRREYGEPMLQLLRDQLRECGPGRWRVFLVWARILADVLRSAPAAYLETQSSSEGNMRLRATLAVVASLLWVWFGWWIAISPFWSDRAANSFFNAYWPLEWPYPLLHTIALSAFLDTFYLVLPVALFLLVMRKFRIGRLARGTLVAVPASLAGDICCMLLSRLLWPRPMFVHVLVDPVIAVLTVALFLLVMKKLGVPRLAGGVLVAVPIAFAGIAGYRSEFGPSMLIVWLAECLRGPMSVVLGAWAANAWGPKRDQAGPDRSELPVVG